MDQGHAMTQDVPNPPPPAPSAPTARKPAWIGRLAAIVVILAVMVAIAHFLGGAVSRSSHPGAAGPGGEQQSFITPAPQPLPATSPERTQAQDALRQMMGVLMNASDNATDGQGEFKDPLNQDPKARRDFLSSFLGVPHDFPRSGVPEGLVPPQAEILMAANMPDGQRMTLIRMKVDINEAMSAIQKYYAGQGWTAPDPLVPERQPDQGWLVRFTRGGQERVVYARPRQVADQTLLAIYEPSR
jgi:hypothetical protein